MPAKRAHRLAALLPCVTLFVCFAGLVAFPPPGLAQPAPEQLLYWWQDEIRVAASAWGEARHGHVSQWPAMSLPGGQIVMPLPPSSGAIRADGRLEEDAWQQATSFPVGPIFADWSEGPFLLQVSACRDAENVYLAIVSPRNLEGLGALGPDGQLFTIGEAHYHVGPGGGLPGECVGRSGVGHVIELAIPQQGGLDISLATETLRRVEGKLPQGAEALGLQRVAESANSRDFRTDSLWLQPISVRLVPSPATARLSWSVDRENMQLLTEVREPGQPLKRGLIMPRRKSRAWISTVSWSCEAAGEEFSMEGFLYLPPIRQQIDGILQILQRSAAMASQSATAAPTAKELNRLRAAALKLAPGDTQAWRKLHCQARRMRAQAHLSMLDRPLLFVKQRPYFAAHIYDDYYEWHPGGGIYILEKPSDPTVRTVRPIIDPQTNETLGDGVYRDPELSWDASRVVFAYKPAADAVTSIYEIEIDGSGLRRLTASDKHHDITPAYLSDGRIVFTSTRPRALVPCFNSGVDTLHTMNPDGSQISSISSNNVNEFDPAVMPDGRIVYGRWEYVDKTALYMQSLWTVSPDGRMEEALFGNNLAKPTAILDPRPVPGSSMVAASLTPHNGQAVGAIGMIDTAKGKNDLGAIFNFTPEYPVEMDQGLRTGPSDPYPLSPDDVLITNNAIGAHGIIELVGRDGNRELVHCDPQISCFSPVLVQPRAKPLSVSGQVPGGDTGRFLLVDVYQGLEGVQRGTIKRLRIVEETARTSGIPPGGRWWNQAFLVSWQGAYIVKNMLGTVPVHEDGSAYFEVPAGRAVYFEALDSEGREIQRMRTFVQATPGTTRSCVGCHEYKKSAAKRTDQPPLAMLSGPARPEPESWGSGYIDYPTMLQPILDKYCVRCHGGPDGMAMGLDFSGGWTWAFNIGYETLIKHRLTGFLNCHNSSVHTSQILPPRTIGSGAAPLAEILIKRHPEVTRPERDLLLAWMDTNSNYYGTWDYTPHATCDAVLQTRGPLSAVMQEAGCNNCHQPGHIGNDWVNLQTPEWSRILRAAMAKTEGGLGLEMCRNRKAQTGYPLVDQRIQPPDVMTESRQPLWDPGGEPHVSWTSADEPHRLAMLNIIRHARAEALARPRVDMPGAEVVPGECRLQVPIPVPDAPPQLVAGLREDQAVELCWQRTAETIGLGYELHRGPLPQFAPAESTQIGLTTAGRFLDPVPPQGTQHYALVVTSGSERSGPIWTSIDVPKPRPPAAPASLTASPRPGQIALAWEGPATPALRYDVYRTSESDPSGAPLNEEPLTALSYVDSAARPGVAYAYHVRATDRRGQQSAASVSVGATALPEIKEPVFVVDFSAGASARLLAGKAIQGRLYGDAKTAEGYLQTASGGFAAFQELAEFQVPRAFSLELWVRIDREAQMPVIASCGAFNSAGWFLQRYGRGWRWHLAPVSCDGGRPAVGRWTHLVGTFDGQKARLYQDGKLVAQVDCYPNRAAWDGPLVIGQYSHQDPSYQVHGSITGLKIYHRALPAEEVLEKHRAGVSRSAG